MFSFIPPKINGCGYSLVAADPLWGAFILKDHTMTKMGPEESYLSSLQHFLRSGAKLDLFGPSKLDQFDLKRKSRKYTSGDLKNYPRMFDWLVNKSIVAKQSIEANIKKIQKHLQVSCKNLEVIRVPVLAAFTTELDFSQSSLEDIEKAHIHFRNPVPNMIVLDDHLVVADFRNSPSDYQSQFQDTVLEQLMKSGLPRENIHFVNASFYHNGMGSIHCGSLVIRLPKELVAPSP